MRTKFPSELQVIPTVTTELVSTGLIFSFETSFIMILREANALFYSPLPKQESASLQNGKLKQQETNISPF